MYPLSHLIGLLWTWCFSFYAPQLELSWRLNFSPACCVHFAGHGQGKEYDLEFSYSRHGSFSGRARKPTCSTGQSSAWRSQSQSQTSCWIYWQTDCLPRSASTDLWGGASHVSSRFVAWKLRQAYLWKLHFERLRSPFLWSSFRSTHLCHL